jgi:SanA protein
MRLIRRYAKSALITLLLAAAFIIAVPVGMRAAMSPYMYVPTNDVPKTDVALVLGASVRGGKPSPVLARRAQTAVELYLKGKVSKILVTGDNGALTHDEVTPVRKFLIDAGIPAGDIFLDHAGFDTYSSMYRARDVFLADSVTIVTQDFHLPRALFIARHLGMEAYGVAAEGGEGTGRDYTREIPASIKAMLNLFTRRVPKYLGETIPLSGDGSTTWY